MKLLIVMPSGVFRGGSEEVLLQFVRARGAAGLETPVVFLQDGDVPPLVRAEGVQVTVLEAGRFRQAGRYLKTIGALRRIIRAERPRAVIGWMTKGHLYGGVAAALSGTPAAYFQMGRPDGGWIDVLARYIPAAGALACSEFIAREQQALVSHRVIGIPMAFDDRRTARAAALPAPEAKIKFGFDPARPLVGIVGRLQRWKGMHVFVQAMAEVLKTRPECQAVIVGGKHHLEPDYPAFLDDVIAAAGLRNRIHLAGSRSDAMMWMQAMDVFVHASDAEPFGLVIVEAMSLGKAVIATREGGPSEIIQPGVNGQLTPFGDVPALSRAILRYLEDPAFARRCAEAARERARAFTIPQYVRRVRSAMEQLLG